MLSLPKYLLPLAFLFAVADHAAAAPPEDERAAQRCSRWPCCWAF